MRTYLSFHKKCVGFSSNTLSFNLYQVTSDLFGLIHVSEEHHCYTTFFTIKKMPSDFFSLINNDHKKLPIEFITVCHKIALKMFLTCTPIVFAITLLENSMWALTIAISRACFVASWSPLSTCLFPSKTLITIATTSC